MIRNLVTAAAALTSLAAVGCLHPYAAHPCTRPDLSGCVVEKVVVSGDKSVSADEITGKIATAQSSHVLAGLVEDVPILGLWDRLSVDYAELDPFVLERDMARVERVYRSKGYYDAHARAARVRKIAKDRVRVDIVVEEGAPVLVRRVVPSFEGARPPEPVVHMIEGIVRGQKEGSTFDEDRFEAAKKELKHALTNVGYAYARVFSHAAVDLVARRADLTYSIDAGPPCTFGPISVEGYGDLPKDKLLQAIRIREGQRFSSDRIDTAQTALSDLRVLGSVEATPELTAARRSPLAGAGIPALAAVAPLAQIGAGAALSADGRVTAVPVVFKVTSTTLKTVKMGVGAEVGSRVEVHGVASWDNRNFLGGLRHLFIEGKPGIVINPLTFATLFSKPVTPIQPLFEVRLHAELEQPGFVEPRTRGLVSVAANLYQLQPLDTLGYFELAGKAGVARDWWRRQVNASLHVNMAFDQPTKLDSYTPIDVAGGYHKLVLPYVQALGVLDLRKGENGKPDPLNPHSGFYLSNEVQMAWVDSQDIRIHPEVRGYVPIARHWTLALRATTGFLFALGGDLAKTPTPACPYSSFAQCVRPGPGGSTIDRSRYIQVLQLRGFTSGGPTSNRGYAYNGVGPQEQIPNISAIGPNGQLVPLATGGSAMWEASVELRFPLPVDKLGATLFFDASDVRWHIADLLAPFAPHLSTGIGLRYLTPVGPFRADFGVRIPGAQVLGKGTCPVYDPNGNAQSSTCYLDASFGQAGPVFSLPLAVSLALGEAY